MAGYKNAYFGSVRRRGKSGKGKHNFGIHPVGTYDPWGNLHDFTGLPMTSDGWTDFVSLDYMRAQFDM